MKTPTTFLNRALTSRPSFRLCRSAVLISAAIAVTSANAVVIGRLPSTSVTGGEVVGVKPNLFLVIDNGIDMIYGNSGSQEKYGNLLQQTAAGLIAALPQLEGLVRVGYTTTLPGIEGGAKNTKGQWHCKDYRLNGNVTKIAKNNPALSMLPEELAKNQNYIFLKKSKDANAYNGYIDVKDDFLFKDWGSGYGEVAPRDFQGNYAKYIYAWLGGMCPSYTSEAQGAALGYVVKHPPYAELANDSTSIENYKAKTDKSNPHSLPLRNRYRLLSGGARPLIPAYMLMLSQVSDVDFISKLMRCEGSYCGGRMNVQDDPLRTFYPNSKRKYDSYSTISDDGFPGTDDPKSCRKNYTIIISQGAYNSANMTKAKAIPNTHIGVLGIVRSYGYNWILPKSYYLTDENKGSYTDSDPKVGILNENFPYNASYMKPYRFFSIADTNNKRLNLATFPRDTVGVDGRFLFSKTALQGYYYDLRSDLKNDVPAYYKTMNDRVVGKNLSIPRQWDRKNDTANWQHMTLFVLGFKEGFSAWDQVAKLYNPLYSDLDSEGGVLEGYFRAIEDGSIHEVNAPVFDLARGQYGTYENGGATYFFKDRAGKVSPFTLKAKKIGDTPLGQLDFAKTGVVGRGGTFEISDYGSIKAVVSQIAARIKKAMASGVTGGSIGGGSRITGTIQQAGGSNSVLFTTYMDEETTSGNLFTFKNCPLIQKKIRNAAGKLEDNPLWARYKCGVRLWNAATVLDKAAKASNYLANKTIVPVKQANGELQAQNFTWANLKGDTELKAALQDGNSEALGEARLEWINGRLQSTFSDDIKSKLRVRTTVSIPEENQRYSRGEDGKLVKDDNGTLIEAKTTRIPNRMGEIVYAAPQAVEPVGTLPAAHPLNDQSYTDFIKRSIIGNDRNNPARPAMVIVGANDGRLYGFTSPKPDAGYAELKFSFIPRTLLINGSVTATTLPNYNTQNAKSLVNGPFTVRDAKVGAKNASAAWGTYVVGTLGAGGNAIYALDISSGQAEFKWEVRLSDLHSKADDKTPISGTENMQGAIMAPPRIVWLRDTRKTAKPTGKWVVLVPSGYNSNEVSLLVLDLANGELLANIQTGARYSKVKAESNSSVLTCTLNELSEGSRGLTAIHRQLSSKITLPVDSTVGCDNGLGPLTAIDSNSDGGVDYVYAGDLLGHIWKFDLTEFFQSGKGKVAYNSPLFVAQTHGDNPTRQPITSMIEVADSQNGEGNMLYFGTGRLFNQEERGLNQQETFYAVWDNPRYFEDGIVSLPMNRASTTGYKYVQYVSIPLADKDATLNDGGKGSILRDENRFGDLRGIQRYQDSTTSTAYLACNLDNSCLSDDGIMGWAMDFPPAKNDKNKKIPALERVIDRGQVFENAIYFSSFTPNQGKNGESCDTKQKTVGGEGRFYSLNRFTGNYLAKSPFDLNNDNKRDEKDSIKVSSGEMGRGQGDDYATDENGNYLVGLAGVSLGSTNGSFVSLQGVPGINPPVPECDFTRQIIFPASVDTETGDPLTLTGCYQNRFNVWKQPVDE